MRPYSDWKKDYEVATNECGSFFRSDRVLTTATGKDVATFLHGMVSNDIKKLQEGKWVQAGMLSNKGRVLADLTIYHHGDSYWIESGTNRRQTVEATLTNYRLRADVTFTDLSRLLNMVTVVGKTASNVLRMAFPNEIVLPSVGEIKKFVYAGAVVNVSASVDPSNPSYNVFFPTDLKEKMVETLRNIGVCPIASEAWEALRMEAGMPIYGIDMGEENILLEVPYLRKAVSFEKGCYIGQEPIARLHARGENVSRHLMGIKADDSAKEIQVGAKLHEGDKEVGLVTSASYSPRLSTWLGLTFIHRGSAQPGKTLTLDSGGEKIPVTVVSLPLT